MIELLAPVGDFECLKAAVQNGADCVYFGSSEFNARASATNFDLANLEKAISYAKLRGVKTNLTLNTLIKNNEFEDAYKLAKKAYELGIDAIIVQDLGLALTLIHDFPDLPIHASTQMSVHNLEGVLKLQNLGFKRVVLARELSSEEIAFICQHSNIEIECFIHGALCISFSGQCLLSSMIGGRSGNRGKCAQPCRLPYSLIDKNDVELDNGYLLSPRDLCALEYLPFLINCGVTSFKIEGRMKTPEYVATVTKIYRKYIDLAMSANKFVIDENDKKDLLQVFNRGLSSTGHLSPNPNRELVYKSKSNNMGLPLGIVQKYNKTKGYITIKLTENLHIGDTISLEKETGTYTVSELMENSNEKSKNKFKNISIGKINQTVTIGRMKGNISVKDKVYKMSSKELTLESLDSINSESKKILLNAKISIKKDKPISICVTSNNNLEIYNNLHIEYNLDDIPIAAKTRPLTKEVVIEKIEKTGQTPFKFSNICVDLDDNLFLAKLSNLNELRRKAIEQVENFAINKIKRTYVTNFDSTSISSLNTNSNSILNSKSNKIFKVSVFLNILNLDYEYSKLENADNIYVPLKYFSTPKYDKILSTISKKFDLYIYLPTIIKANYRNIFYNNIESAVKKYNIKGFVLSNISNFVFLEDLFKNTIRNFELVCNYTFNIFNNNSITELCKLGISRYTISPELDQNAILTLYHSNCIQEMIVYGKVPLMNINYCLLGKTNKCFPQCDSKCMNSDNNYCLKDRLQMKFDILPDNIQTVTTIFNCKTLSILPSNFNLDFARIDILYENINEINDIINKIKNNSRFEGKEFTNGNLNREI